MPTARRRADCPRRCLRNAYGSLVGWSRGPVTLLAPPSEKANRDLFSLARALTTAAPHDLAGGSSPSSRRSSRPRGAVEPDARVEERVHGIDDEVDQHDAERDEDDDALRHRRVTQLEARQRGLTEPGQAPHVLDEERPAQSDGEVH